MSFSLKTKRLLLRDFKPSDFKAVHDYAADPLVTRYMPWGPNTPRQSRAFLRKAIRSQKENPRRVFELAVVDKATKELLGGMGIRMTSGGTFEGEMGYCLKKDAWGKGYGTEGARALLRWGFQRLKLRRLRATCDAENKASARVLEKAGMRREGLLRKNSLQKGRWRDTLLFAVLREELPSFRNNSGSIR
jgi:RimJ/RimL family protein N-acetyltransferase